MSVVSLQGNIDRSYYRLLQGQEAGSLVDSFEARRPSVAERLESGKALREKVPRAAHARYERHADWPDPVSILEQQNVTRVQKLVPVRYARMLVSPFAFLRGSAAVMASDLSPPRPPPASQVNGLRRHARRQLRRLRHPPSATWSSPSTTSTRCFPGPWEWDLKRLAASAVVAVRFMGGDNAAAQEAARACVRSYRKRMRRYADMGHLEVWYDSIDEAAVLGALSPKVRPRRRADDRQGTRQGSYPFSRQAHRTGRRRASHRRGRAADRA